MFCLSVAVISPLSEIRRTSDPIQDIAAKTIRKLPPALTDHQANGLNHYSRGQRPRFLIEKMFAL
jgi:hypothetical protein